MARNPFFLRHPVEYVCGLYEARRGRIGARGWSLADVYRELGGGSPRSSEVHNEFRDFFNGQARQALAPQQDPAKLEYWAGIPSRGAALRDEALEILASGHAVKVARASGQVDPETRSLILAHNQIDVELHAHFVGVVERDRPRPRRAMAQRAVRSGAICVLGAPRSGTSLTSRILNILGVDLGPEDELMPAVADNNRAGFWEHKGIADLNEEILAALSETPPPYLQGWRWPPRLDDGWEQDPTLAPQRRTAKRILRLSFIEPAPLWGWKDPRTSLTLPFWQELVAEMRYVICVRHPLEVAASLAARDGMPADESLRLWSRYMADSMTHTSGKRRLFISYESYFADWEKQANRLSAFLGTGAPSNEQREAIAKHIDGALRHHSHAEEWESALPQECASLYEDLSELTQT